MWRRWWSRRAPGAAAFHGTIGVTLPGLFRTPVFYVVVRGFHPRETSDRPAGTPPARAIELVPE